MLVCEARTGSHSFRGATIDWPFIVVSDLEDVLAGELFRLVLRRLWLKLELSIDSFGTSVNNNETSFFDWSHRHTPQWDG